MKKKISMIGLGVCIASSMLAAPLSPQQALERFSSTGHQKARSINLQQYKLASTLSSRAGNPAAFVFDKPGSGFIILGADDMSAPLLGYSDTNKFDPASMPPALKWWVEEYGRQAEFASSRANKSAKAVYAPAEWDAVAPLVKTTWDQGAPYNAGCPMINSTQAPTGCVATSFAQVMNYFKYPEIGQGTVKYTAGDKTYFMGFDRTPFDWDNMLDSYSGNNYTQQQADAVSYLMKACGYSVEMTYGQYASGANSFKLASAAVEYFKYDPSIRFEDRNYFSADQWYKMVYDNIKNVGPIIYNGTAIDGGHSFVCDGYDGNGYFHINWGWGGTSDGYYLLDNLSPELQGTGGASGGFNYSQDALFNMHKPDGSAPVVVYNNMLQYGTCEASISQDIVSVKAVDALQVGWANAMFVPINVKLGMILEGANIETQYLDAGINRLSGNAILEVGHMYTGSVNKIMSKMPEGLPDGVYKVSLATKDNTVEDAPWQPMLVHYGNANYFWLKVNGTDYSVENVAYGKVEYDSAAFDSPLYYNRNASFNVKVTNPSEFQLTRCIAPVLIANNKVQFNSDYILYTVDPKSDLEMNWVVKFYKAAGSDAFAGGNKYTLGVMDIDNRTIVGTYGEYVMDVIGDGFTLKLDKFTMPGVETKEVVSGSRTFKNVYEMSSASGEASLEYHVVSGYFDSNLRVGVTQYDPDTKKWNVINDQLYLYDPFLSEGESQIVPLKINMENQKGELVYRLMASYIKNGKSTTLGTLDFTFKSSGISDIMNDSDMQDVEFYNLQGVKVHNPQAGQILIMRKGSKVEKVIF